MAPPVLLHPSYRAELDLILSSLGTLSVQERHEWLSYVRSLLAEEAEQQLATHAFAAAAFPALLAVGGAVSHVSEQAGAAVHILGNLMG